ncbi:hypothetical protein Btru_017742 [Bulinus truncatus]|nr:hypothetical protein Btru_017742 [Bulinus truncatus]
MDCISKGLYIICLLNGLILAVCTMSACEPGWFGDRCSYICHCDTSCDQTGECIGTNKKCARGWFGYKCQYQDLLTLPTLTLESSLNQTLEAISDRDDTTCLDSHLSVGNLTFKWDTSYVFTWLRLAVNDENLMSSFSINFEQDTKKLTCDKKHLYKINNSTMDIRCLASGKFNQITFTGLGLTSLCSLYINGGRNVALKQNTTMSSMYRTYTSSYAVDGNIDGIFYHNSCVHTGEGDTSPWWRINITKSLITRYTVHNRMDSNSRRLNGFTFIAQLENATVLYHHDNSDEEDKKEYIILDENSTEVSSTTISQNISKEDALHFCEVEIFGECTQGTWGLDCTKCPSHCPFTCNVDDGRCNMVCFGHSNPPNCNTSCRANKFGVNCANTCSDKCLNKKCHPETGRCFDCKNGTTSYYYCDNGTWGFNCSETCDSNCRNQNCNKTNGNCMSGCAGDYWGNRCDKNCSSLCKNKKCRKWNGECLLGCEGGFQPPSCTQSCDTSWFGDSCEYKCHCDEGCNKTGDCLKGRCSAGWFGYKCQYHLIVKAEPINQSPITDSDDETCGQHYKLRELKFKWRTYLVFTWMRIVVNDTSLLSKFAIRFKNSSQGTNFECENPRFYLVNNRTFDVRCDMNQPIDELFISGEVLNNICSLYVNGGRNVGLKQKANQTSNYVHGRYTLPSSQASNAVDGNTGDLAKNSCSHTDPTDKFPMWSVQFPPSSVTRYVLFNRLDSYYWYPKNFTLLGLKDKNEVFNYTDKTGYQKKLYEPFLVLDRDKSTISEVQISVSRVLSLCEVEIYGECAPGTWGLNCTKCPPSCDLSCNVDDGRCSRICIGHDNPPDCNKECEPGKWGMNCRQTCSNCKNQLCNTTSGDCLVCLDGDWGQNCSNKCSDNCRSNVCHKITGECQEGCVDGNWGPFCNMNCSDKCNNVNKSCTQLNGHCVGGCEAGFQTPHCNETCNPGNWGPNCSIKCSDHCFTSSCDGETSQCIDGCKEGYHFPNCTEECDPIHFGRNCSQKCSTNCSNQECDKISGTCSQCTPGRQGQFCENDCDTGKYGQNCTLNCSSVCLNEHCDPVNGACLDCPKGRYRPQCAECPHGRYGYNCSHPCSDQCKVSKTCEPVNGECYDGCQDGYKSLTCNATCDDNTYGQGCAMSCSLFCLPTDKTAKCHHITGVCHSGCFDSYQGPLCLEEKEASSLFLVFLVFLLVGESLAVTFVLLRIYRRRNNKGPFKFTLFSNKDKVIINELTDNNEVPSTRNDNYVSVKDLSTFIDSHDSQFYIEQFKFPISKGVTTEAAFKNENRAKNRYKNIVPYDHSRVHLELNTDKKESDYINASFIRGYQNKVRFIASQGPNKESLNDFIRMLLEQEVEKVVMLTNLVEDTKNKCEQYWPSEGSQIFGEIKVSLTKTTTFADYTIRNLKLVKNEETHKLQHFHFTSWPDHGVPTTPWPLIEFQLRVLSSQETKPIVVHCSAGVGRTGTFIALINIMSQAETSGRVDFLNTVARLREDRMLMVQTARQYEFLHIASQAAIVCHAATIRSVDIQTRLKLLGEWKWMEEEFTAVCRMASHCRRGTLDEKKEENSEVQSEDVSNIYENSITLKKDLKDRFPFIVPRNCDRPVLTCGPANSGDYINAVFIPGCGKRDQHFLTQLPMPATVVDFWRLVYQYKISLIVAFEMDTAGADETVANYLPNGQDNLFTCPPFKVQTALIHDTDIWTEHIVQVYTSASKLDLHSLVHLKANFTDLDNRKLVSFVKKLRSFKAQTEGRILFTCRDGATYSGIVCVMSLLLDRLANDSCFNVPLVVGTIKTVRPEVIPSLGQYKTVYESLKLFNERLDEDYFPKSKSVKINNPTFDATQVDDEMIYSNV